jgi:hypothetical protein
LGLKASPVKNDIATEIKTEITILHIPPNKMARVLLFLLKFKDPPPDLNNGKRKLKKRVER